MKHKRAIHIIQGGNINGEKTNYKLDAVLILTADCIEVNEKCYVVRTASSK